MFSRIGSASVARRAIISIENGISLSFSISRRELIESAEIEALRAMGARG
jgi:hypothetical protein